MLNTMFSIIPIESSIRLFGLTHLSVLIISLILAFVIIKYKKESVLFEKLSTVIMISLQLILYIWYYFSAESFIVKALPLYTCRIAIYMLFIGIFFNKEFWLKIGNYWGFFGGFFGLLLPTIFDYPFPHILQITTFYLHSYLFLISTYYLFVKRIGMNKKDLKSCCKFTVIFLTLVTIVNVILGSNYSATLKMPSVLLKLGISFPIGTCLVVVVIGYLSAIVLEYIILKKYKINSIK